MKKIKVAVNGGGRIGRAFVKLAHERPEIGIVALNDLSNIENIAYLLKFDSVYGQAPFSVQVSEDKKSIILGGAKNPDGSKSKKEETIAFLSEKDPAKLPWRALEIDVVVEATGIFTSFAGSKVHLDVGAKRVVITAPAKDEPSAAGVSGATVLIAINEDQLEKCDISSNASCTTNAGSPLMAILHEAIGIEKAILNTVHGYTASQALVDGISKKDFREGRAAAQNIVPSSTGAAIAVTKALPELAGKFDGISIRVPVVCGSIADITFIAKRDTTVEEINDILTKAAATERWAKVFAVTTEQIVSSDIIGASHASIADLSFTRVVGGNLVKVLAWYDNEIGYTNTLVEHVMKVGKFIK